MPLEFTEALLECRTRMLCCIISGKYTVIHLRSIDNVQSLAYNRCAAGDCYAHACPFQGSGYTDTIGLPSVKLPRG